MSILFDLSGDINNPIAFERAYREDPRTGNLVRLSREEGLSHAPAGYRPLTGVDGSTFNATSSQASARSSRLEGNIRELYHETDPSRGSSILSSQLMERGASGSVGGGIYFAESPDKARQKATRHGCMLRARVKLGSVRTMNSTDSSVTFSSLLGSGYDSVRLTCLNGDEYVVYNSDQVVSITRIPY